MYGLTVILLTLVNAFFKDSSDFIAFSNLEQVESPGKGIGVVTLVEKEKNDPFFTIDKQTVYYVQRDFPLKKSIEKVFQKYAVNKGEIGIYFLDALTIMFYTYPNKDYIEQQINDLKLDKSAYFPLSSFQLEYFETLPKDCTNFFTFSAKTQELVKTIFNDIETIFFSPVLPEIMQIFRNRLKNLPRKKREFLSKVLDDPAKLETVICWLCSRSFNSPLGLEFDANLPTVSNERLVKNQERSVLIPIVDLINCCFSEDPQNDSGPEFTTTEDKVIFSINKHFKEGEEVCFKYSSISNIMYYLNYGFFDPSNKNDNFSMEVSYLPTEENKELIKKLDILETNSFSAVDLLNQAEQQKKVKLKFEIDNYQQAMSIYGQLTGKLPKEAILEVISICSAEIERVNTLIYSLQETKDYLAKHTLDHKLVEERLNVVRIKLIQSRLYIYYLINASDNLLKILEEDMHALI